MLRHGFLFVKIAPVLKLNDPVFWMGSHHHEMNNLPEVKDV